MIRQLENIEEREIREMPASEIVTAYDYNNIENNDHNEERSIPVDGKLTDNPNSNHRTINHLVKAKKKAIKANKIITRREAAIQERRNCCCIIM